MDAELTIDGGPNEAKAYIGWAPVPCRLRLVGPHGESHVRVTVRNGGARHGGGVVFATDADRTFTETVDMNIPGDGTPVDVFVAGEFPRASDADGDASVEVVEAASGERMSITPLMVRVRKDASTLTASERDRFLAALGELNDGGDGVYADFPLIHHEDGLAEAHGNAGFLPWHRAFLLDLERELQSIDASVALPYWRFDEPAPALFSRAFLGRADATGVAQFDPGHPLEMWRTDSIPGIFRTPQFSVTGPSPFVQPDTMTLMMGGPGFQYARFRSMEGNPHGRAHTSFTGFLYDPITAARDPLFFLLHSNVDRLWARWQWMRRRFDADLPVTFWPQGAFGMPNTTSAGHNLEDTMWPWNGVTGGLRPPAAPGGAFPASRVVAAPGPMPTVRSMIDYQGVLNPSSRLAFDYDDVPFERVP